jgi:phospholipid/cholesterol/gamma-HCH transport system permease protein
MIDHTAPQAKKNLSFGGSIVITFLTFLGETATLAYMSLVYLVRGRLNIRETINQMSAIGADSLSIVMITTLSTGAVFAYYTADIFIHFGAANYIGGTLTLSFLMELGPLLAGVTVSARIGAAIAAEIGSMVVTEQVDALRSMAVSPIRYLVLPRIVACVLMLPVLGVFADLAGVGGSFLMALYHGVPGQTFLESARTFVTERDMIKGLVKTIWFGFTIAVIACHQGLKTEGGAVGVGRSTTRSVVLCVMLIFISDFFLAQLLSGASITIR